MRRCLGKLWEITNKHQITAGTNKNKSFQKKKMKMSKQKRERKEKRRATWHNLTYNKAVKTDI